MNLAVEEIGSGSPLPKLFCGPPTMTAKLAGMEVECLVDTGSLVTLVFETFYKQKLESRRTGRRKDADCMVLMDSRSHASDS